MDGYGLFQTVSKPTRITNTSRTTLDLIFCSNPHLIEHLSIESELGSSDHCFILCHLSIGQTKCTTFRRKVWLYQKTDFEALNDALENALPPDAILVGGNVDVTWPLFKVSFIDTISRFIPKASCL